MDLEWKIIIGLSLYRAITSLGWFPEQVFFGNRDERRFGFFLSFLTTFLWLSLFNLIVGGIPNGFIHVSGYIASIIFIVAMALPITILTLQKTLK